MVGFRNNVGTSALTNWVSPQSQQIAFGRGLYSPPHVKPSFLLIDNKITGALGFVAINNADSAWSTTFTTSLPAGSYCDVISGISSSGACTGTGYVHFGGFLTIFNNKAKNLQDNCLGWYIYGECTRTQCYCHSYRSSGYRFGLSSC